MKKDRSGTIWLDEEPEEEILSEWRDPKAQEIAGQVRVGREIREVQDAQRLVELRQKLARDEHTGVWISGFAQGAFWTMLLCALLWWRFG